MSAHAIDAFPPAALTASALPYWPADRLAAALTRIAKGRDTPLTGLPDVEDASRWMAWLGDRLSLRVEEVEAGRDTMAPLLQRVGRAILWHPGALRFLVVLGRSGRDLRLLAPDGTFRRCPARTVALAHLPQPHPSTARQIRRLAEAAVLSASATGQLAQAIVSQVEHSTLTGGVWTLRPARPESFLRDRGLMALIAAVFVLSLAAQAAEVIGWAIAGSGALLTSAGWRWAWLVCLAAALPIGLGSMLAAAAFARRVAGRIRHRLMLGALVVSPDLIKAEGSAGLLARGMEAQSFEAATTQLALGSLAATSQLIWTVWILAQGAAPVLTLSLLGLWIVAQVTFGLRFGAVLREWSDARRSLTARLVERMVGHRTILAQEDPNLRAQKQDAALTGYLHLSRKMDRAGLSFMAAVPLGWMLAATAALAPAYVEGASTTRVAISLGGVFLAGRCLGGLSGILAALATARSAWAQIAALADLPPPSEARRDFMALSSLTRPDRLTPVLTLSGATLSHGGAPAILRQADFTILPGDRLLLEGPSGAGKSSLVRVLSGQAQLQAGALILCGVDADRHPLRHRIIAATPQFHDNHIFSGSMAFNLLLARGWPASPADLTAAREVCDKLGLTPLIQRMPGGMMTQLGETGWQLSHGEKSRIFLARSLLQRAQAVVLDESFAALDPQTLTLCLQAARECSNALLVVAHP